MTINCEVAVARHANAVRWSNLWNILTWVFGLFLLLILIYMVVAAIQSNITQAAVGLVGSIVDGVVVSWVTKQRATAHEEEKQAFQDVVDNCPDQKKAALDQRAKFNIK
jgi:hypothetical protein